MRELSHCAGRTKPDGPVVPEGVLVVWWATYVGSQLVAIPGVVILMRAFAPAFSRFGESGFPSITVPASDVRAIAAWACVGGVFRLISSLLAARLVWSISKAEDGALAAPPPRPDL